jgi:hypothetical protein
MLVKIRFLLLAVVLFALSFTTCDTPLGMGNPIDWEPPVVTVIPKPPTPMYVKFGAELSGTVTDNVAVDRVIMRDSVSGEQLFTAQLLPNNRWLIKLNFSAEQNGETILADIVAYDHAGNSGAESIASVVLIIDIHPPLVDDIWVQRTSVRTANLLSYDEFKQLEIDDPYGELSKNADVYQNGAFYIQAKISENDTTIEKVTLKIYDSEEPDIELLSIAAAGSFFNPRWLLKEDMILDAGAAKIKSDYKTKYKTGTNVRYYYRVSIVATDKSLNDSIEDQKFICLWNEADFPKGILDPRVVGTGTDITVTKGSTLPIVFFDDDKLDWTYAALFTKDQWDGKEKVASDFSLSGTDEAKFSALQTRLLGAGLVYNWRYDKYSGATAVSEPVENRTPDGADEKLDYIMTGSGDTDYGDFVFVTLVKDKKLSPHEALEYPDIVKYRKYNIGIVDDNIPLIVFDKAGGSPEENTFPDLTTDGKFTIKGYTLRDDKNIVGTQDGPGTGGLNTVVKFRLAWVPFALASTDSTIEGIVKDALGKDSGYPTGVQHWDLSSEVNSPGNTKVDIIAGNRYRKQLFSKTFSILGDQDDKNSAYYNFSNGDPKSGGTLENATKLFIFYAEDQMGHPVTTQFYLLGNKVMPTINIYEITDKVTMSTTPPSVYDNKYDSPTGAITDLYISDRDEYNKNNYSSLKGVSGSLASGDLAENFRSYPRGTIIKMWANAKANGALAIKEIKMEDITYQGKKTPLGYYNADDSSLGYVEYFPDVSQRVFLFTAIDQLGNEAQAQRTIAIANAATLTSITTAKQNGTYPKDDIIEIKANFDGMIKLQSYTNGTRPKLNVLYQIKNAGGTNEYGVQQIECETLTTAEQASGVLYLTFNFKVPENAQGMLQTIYTKIDNKPLFANHPSTFPSIPSAVYAAIDRPITLTAGNNIMDVVRETIAYTPGNVTGFFWDTAKGSLQQHNTQNPNGKTINLDGIVPTITGIKIVDTKNAYTSGTPNLYYFKSGESISIELEATKNLKISGDTSFSYRLQRPTQDGGGYTTYNTTAFAYRKINGKKLVFTLDVNSTNIIVYHGQLVNITLVNPGNITDETGNKILESTFTTLLTSFNNANQIYFDLLAPQRPVTTLTGAIGGGAQGVETIGTNPTTTLNYSATPYMIINSAPAAQEPYQVETRQYSLNGGLRWVDFPNALDIADYHWTTPTISPAGYLNILNGQWTIKTRYIDRAGNEGATTDQLVYINNVFPKLLGVSVLQPKATYIAGDTLSFTLDFDDIVISPASGVTLTLEDTGPATNTPGGTNPTYQIQLIAAATPSGSRTVTFNWTSMSANTKDMLNGLKITALSINNLKDKFGNGGPSTGIAITPTTVTISGNAVNYNINDAFSGVKVSTIQPTIRSREPQNALNRNGNITLYSADPENVTETTIATGSISADNKTIRLNFSKGMQKGNGTITIRPHTGYAIPAVFEHEGYYLTVATDGTETRSSSAGTNSTYVSGFYDIFNSINDTDRNTLIGSTLMSAPAVSNITGLSVGPYLKTTHGLTQGAGYTGNYGNPTGHTATVEGTYTITLPGNSVPGTRGANLMVPDIETKWVLAYMYDDLFSTATTGTLATVTNIRAVLDRAKFRWQEIAVTASNVSVSGKSVTIVLSEPLLPGLQWDLSYTAGTFTDEAGNTAAGVNRGDYWFWSKGVQRPVIRVDRRSFDARPGGAAANYSGDSFSNGSTYNANGYAGNIGSFETVNYRINSETPQARIFSNTQRGADGVGSITALWTSSVPVVNAGLNITADTTITWQGAKNDAATYIGRWVRPNLHYRNHRGSNDTVKPDTIAAGRYYIIEDGMNLRKNVGGSPSNGFGANNDNFYGFRSFNKDATFTELNGLSIPNTAGATFQSSVPGNFTYSAMQASKDYVAAIARIDHTNTGGTYTVANAVSSQKGFEGVFRTVVAMNQTGLTAAGSNGAAAGTNWTTTTMPLMIAGTNVRSGLPTISGFPLKDGVHRNDSRFIKVFYRNETTNVANGTNGKQFYWVTTEIVSAWYLQLVGRGDGQGSYSRMGDVEDWVSAGYGDLTYALNLATW